MSTGRDFTSDNSSGAAPAVMEAVGRANGGTARAYGDDPYTEKLRARLADLFSHEVEVFPMFTGTAANSVALSCLVPPYGAIFCHEEAHITTSECGAPEFFSGGAKLVGLKGEATLIEPAGLSAAIGALGKGVTHHVQPAALSLSQASECGTLYTPQALRTLTDIARANGLKVHMDGARFANAVAALGCAPADITWRAGVDVLSFGLTKNGALAAEAMVFFDKAAAETAKFRHKRAGQVASKMRFVSVQMLAMLEGGLWLELAAHANAMAKRLAEGAGELGVPPQFATEINEIFLPLTGPIVKRLRAEGFQFHPWSADPETGAGSYRFVTSFATETPDVDALLFALKAALR